MNLPDGNVLTYEYQGERIIVKDKDHNIVLKVWFDGNGNLIKRTKAKWGPIGETITYVSDSSGKIIDIYRTFESAGVCEYDQNGRLRKKTQTLASYYHEYQYDKSGNISQDIIYDLNGTKKEGYYYFYDSKGVLWKQRSISRQDESSCIEDTGDCEKIFDANGNVVSIRYLNQMNDQIKIANDYVCDENGILQESRHQQEQAYGFIHVSGSLGTFMNSYEFIYKDGIIVPSYIYMKACGGYVAIEPLTAEHITGDSCEPKYDGSGKIIKCVHRTSSSLFWTECEFDQNQRKIKETHHLEFGDIVCSYTYDNSGKLIKSTTTGGIPAMVYEYDSYGRVCKFTQGNKYTKGDVSAEFIYDQNGKTHFKYLDFANEDQTSVRAEYSYDDQYNPIKTTYRSENENGYSLKEFNAKNQIIKQTDYAKDNTPVQYTIYTYNDRGLLIKISTICTGGKLLSETVFTYDSAGNQIDWQRRTADGKTKSKYEYEYTDDETYALYSRFNIADLLPAILPPAAAYQH